MTAAGRCSRPADEDSQNLRQAGNLLENLLRNPDFEPRPSPNPCRLLALLRTVPLCAPPLTLMSVRGCMGSEVRIIEHNVA